MSGIQADGVALVMSGFDRSAVPCPQLASNRDGEIRAQRFCMLLKGCFEPPKFLGPRIKDPVGRRRRCSRLPVADLTPAQETDDCTNQVGEYKDPRPQTPLCLQIQGCQSTGRCKMAVLKTALTDADPVTGH